MGDTFLRGRWGSHLPGGGVGHLSEGVSLAEGGTDCRGSILPVWVGEHLLSGGHLSRGKHLPEKGAAGHRVGGVGVG